MIILFDDVKLLLALLVGGCIGADDPVRIAANIISGIGFLGDGARQWAGGEHKGVFELANSIMPAPPALF